MGDEPKNKITLGNVKEGYADVYNDSKHIGCVVKAIPVPWPSQSFWNAYSLPAYPIGTGFNTRTDAVRAVAKNFDSVFTF